MMLYEMIVTRQQEKLFDLLCKLSLDRDDSAVFIEQNFDSTAVAAGSRFLKRLQDFG